MPRYLKRASVVTAERWLDPDHPPRGVQLVKLPEGRDVWSVRTGPGRAQPIYPGEWIVREDDSPYASVFNDTEFKKRFEMIERSLNMTQQDAEREALLKPFGSTKPIETPKPTTAGPSDA